MDSRPNYLMSILFGLLCGSIGSIIWIAVAYWMELEVSYIAMLIGAFVGWGVVTGSKGSKGLPLQVISALITIFAIYIAKYITLMLFVKAIFIETGYDNFEWVPLFDSDVISTVFDISSPMSIAIFIIGVAVAFMVPSAKSRNE